MYEWNEEEKKIDFSHNPFSMPNLSVEEFLALDPKDNDKLLSIKAFQYDIVCNGVELSSGAIRNHRPEVMKKAFAIAGYGEDVLEKKFGGMLHALSLGAPPHGGIAPGIDRIVMLLAGEENLREVVLFPMNQSAEDLMMGAPSEATPSSSRSCTSGWICRRNSGAIGAQSGAALSIELTPGVSGNGMNSISSPGTLPKWPAFHSAFACSMRSLRDDTKFHQMWRGPSIGAPPQITRCASVTAFTVNLSPGLNTRSCPGANVSPAISSVPSTR